MESENGVPLEDEKNVVFEKSKVGIISNSDEPISGENEICKDEITDKEGLSSSGPEIKLSLSVSKIKTSNPSKDSNFNGPKNNKLAKNQSSSKGSVVFGRSTKSSLTQSLSFPARGRHSDVVMKKSIEIYPTKSETKQSLRNDSKVESQVSNGNFSSNPRMNPARKGPFPGLKSKAASKRTTLSSLPSFSKSVSEKHVSANGTSTDPASDVLVEKNSEPSNNGLPVKEDEDEDARSTNSSNLTPRGQHRLNVSAFSFRLQERAEKRKQFFSKIEEKVQAKEVEINNLQAKSKENQDAEIKQLRKSLTFKAAPMPSFYKEPPPKVELKKIPTTRAISPKLGRHKGTASTPMENGGSCISPRVTTDNCKSPKAPQANGEKGNSALKKSIKSSLSKSHAARKVKDEETKGQNKETYAEEIQDRPRCPTELKDQIEEEIPENNSSCSNGSNLASEAMPAEVTVEG